MLSKIEKERYSRHLLLPEVGITGQERLKKARVLVIGLGGLGAPAALYLAAAGIGELGLMDGDTVSLSNLQRQILYDSNQLGSLKADAAAARLKALNPQITVKTFPWFATRERLPVILGSFDLVIDGTDSFSARYLINDACRKSEIPYVHGSVYRFEGNTVLLATKDGPCYRCMFPNPPPVELIPSCAEAGVLGVVPGITGTYQASLGIQYLLGLQKETTVATWNTIDVLTGRSRRMEVKQNPECTVCQAAPDDIVLIDYDLFCGVSEKTAVDSITAKELLHRMKEVPSPLLVDVRSDPERSLDHIGGEHFPLENLIDAITEKAIASTSEIIIYCRSGRRSAVAVERLKAAGFGSACHLDGGLIAWKQQVDPGFVL